MSTALANTKKLYKHNVDLTSSSYNQDTWYPVLIGQCPETDSSIYFKCSIVNGGGTPSWSSHPSKHWACDVEVSYSVSRWGWKSDNGSYIDAYTFGQTSTNPIVLSNALSHTAYLVVYLRGGGYYPIQTSIADTPQIKTSSYTIDSQTVAPTTTQPENTANFVISRREGDTKTNEAAKTATTYITHIDDNGIRIHPSSTTNNSAVINASGMEIFKGGTAAANSVAFYGDTARVGKSATRHIEIGDGGLQVYQDASTVMAHIGYGSGNASSGTSNAPYFVFGALNGSPTLGNYSITAGHECVASGYCSHAEGALTTASGKFSHAEGDQTTASDEFTHAEGYKCTASKKGAHAEGQETQATNYSAHAEGSKTVASGTQSHAEGSNTVASGAASHAGGQSTIAGSNWQTVIGKANSNSSSNAFEIGNGTITSSSITRSNAFEVDWNGNVNIASGAKYKINGTNLSAADVGALATSAKYTRSSAGTVDWTNQADGDAKVIMKSALAYWNGAYSNTNSNLKYSANGEIIGTNTATSKTTFTPTSGSSYSNYGGCYYEKFGKVVHVHVGVSGLTANTDTTIFTLPSGYRPSSTVFAHGTGGAWNNIGYLDVRTNGEVHVRSQGAYCGAEVTYLV